MTTPKCDNALREQGEVGKTKSNQKSNSIITDPLIGWLELSKPSRNRKQKRGWQKGVRK